MFVTKKSGELGIFQLEKIVSGCEKAGASALVAKRVADVVSKNVKERMSTKEIGQLVILELRKVDKKAASNFEKYFKSH